jgi:hypothetical protein
MDIGNVLSALRQEHEQISEAIMSLERLASGQGKRRGRPPAWMANAGAETTKKKRGRKPGSKNAPKKRHEE